MENKIKNNPKLENCEGNIAIALFNTGTRVATSCKSQSYTFMGKTFGEGSVSRHLYHKLWQGNGYFMLSKIYDDKKYLICFVDDLFHFYTINMITCVLS